MRRRAHRRGGAGVARGAVLKPDRLEIRWLEREYRAGRLAARDVLAEVDRRAQEGPHEVWITRVPLERSLAALLRAEERLRAGARLELFGIPFAVKDNIDVAGMPTTAGCPAFAYVPERSATVVERLEQAGAILVGKTNLDQFATGLVGTRSPYGACSSAFDARYISGGSSSGSALAVALGLASFALGTDTAGSGRVPAAFNNVLGYKPTRGVLSTCGIVPACRSLDCVSVFAASAADAFSVLHVASGYDERDPYSRKPPEDGAFGAEFRFGVPRSQELEFFGDDEARLLYERAARALSALGGVPVEFDFGPFRGAAELLYDGPWVAERHAAFGDFMEQHANDVDATVYAIVHAASSLRAADAFTGMHRLRELEAQTRPAWDRMDTMLLPTTGTTYTLDEVTREPIVTNANLGYYTNFVNLLDLAAVAVPAGFRSNGLPFGVSLIAPALDDPKLLRLADRFHRGQTPQVGATGALLASDTALAPAPVSKGVAVAVVGAHLSGEPLNHELTTRGARLIRTCRTHAGYRLFALRDTTPPKPALVRAPGFDGPGIEVEVWELSPDAFGDFVAGIAPPHGIGSVMLQDGFEVRGFICEAHALSGAEDITGHGGWRAFLQARR